MKSKIVVVMNDHTADALYVLEGYNSRFPYTGIPAQKIEVSRQVGEFGENLIVKVMSDGFIHYLDNRNYSFIYEERVTE